jgi:hypothetical protein
VQAALRYAAGLSPAFRASAGSSKTGRLRIDGYDPETHIVVDVGDSVVVSLAEDGADDADGPRLEGPSVDLVEALSVRAPFPHDLPAEDRWLLGGLAAAFDQTRV